MSLTLRICIYCLIFTALTALRLFGQCQSPYERLWSSVYRNEWKELPKSALAATDSIYTKAKRDNNQQEFIKALIYRSKFALELQEDAELAIVRNFEKEIKSSKAPYKNILESMLAQLYWQYFKKNRHKYYNRSQLSEQVSTDFRTWDAATMFRKIHTHFQNALIDDAEIRKTSLSSIQMLLIQSEEARKYRPTLYDFLSHNALDFYGTSESLVTKPIIDFKIDDPRYFEELEKMEIVSPDTLSPLIQALKIYKDLFTFHKERKDTTALVNLEIERLQFIKREGVFENINELYKAALAKLKETFKGHPF